MDDLGDIIPVIGDVLADTAYKELMSKLTPEEYKLFLENNKLLPSSIAVLKTFTDIKRSSTHSSSSEFPELIISPGEEVRFKSIKELIKVGVV